MNYHFTCISKEMNIENLKKTTEENTKTIKLLSEEVARLKFIEQNKKENMNKTSKVITFEDEQEEKENDLLEEINYYFKKIESIDFTLSKDIILDNLKKELPNKKNSNYYSIIYGINALFLKEYNEIMRFIETEKDNLSKEELEEFKRETFTIKEKIDLIASVENNSIEIKEDVVEEEILNNIVFLETSSGNIYALEDLDNKVPQEYYDGFYDLFKSIQDSTFKNVKYLTSNNNKTAGISEVKGFKRRVIFDRVGYNTYVIIGVFTKKSDMDKGYIDQVKNRIAIYRKRKEFIVEKSKDQNYINEQQEILKKLYKILTKEDQKTLEKRLGDDI